MPVLLLCHPNKQHFHSTNLHQSGVFEIRDEQNCDGVSNAGRCGRELGAGTQARTCPAREARGEVHGAVRTRRSSQDWRWQSDRREGLETTRRPAAFSVHSCNF